MGFRDGSSRNYAAHPGGQGRDSVDTTAKNLSGRLAWLGSAAAAAVLAAVLRRWQLSSAFEASGLAVPNAQSSVILLCILVMSAAWFMLLALNQRLTKQPMAAGQAHRWDLVFLDVGDPVYPGLVVAASLLALAAAPVLLPVGVSQWQLYQEAVAAGLDPPSSNGMLTIATAVGALLAALGLLQMGRDGLRPGKRGRGGYSAALPGVAGCIWMMECFRGHAANPVLWDYAPQLLAITCGMMLYMDFAGMSAGASRPRRLLWLAGMTMVLSAVSMVSAAADLSAAAAMGGSVVSAQLGDLLLLSSQILASIAILWRLPPNLENPPRHTGKPSRHTREEPVIQEETTDE